MCGQGRGDQPRNPELAALDFIFFMPFHPGAVWSCSHAGTFGGSAGLTLALHCQTMEMPLCCSCVGHGHERMDHQDGLARASWGMHSARVGCHSGGEEGRRGCCSCVGLLLGTGSEEEGLGALRYLLPTSTAVYFRLVVLLKWECCCMYVSRQLYRCRVRVIVVVLFQCPPFQPHPNVALHVWVSFVSKGPRRAKMSSLEIEYLVNQEACVAVVVY